MFFIVIMRWIQFLYDRILLPVVTTPYFYLLLFVWFWLAAGVTYLFFCAIDRCRIHYMQSNLVKELITSVLFSILIVVALIGLYDLSLYYASTSAFFKSQQSGFAQLGAFGCQNCLGAGTSAQSWMVLQQMITYMFLLISPLFTAYSMSSVAYHLQDSKRWWQYLGVMLLVSGICFGLFKIVGLI